MKRFSFLFLLFLSFSNAWCQRGQLKFEHFTQQTGLPDQQMQFVTQDDLGYMWFGTLLGLVRYDGYNMKVYPIKENRKDIWTTTSIADGSHNLWFSTLNLFGTTTSGLVKYNRNTDNFTSYLYPDKLNARRFVALYLKFADANGNLWGLYTSNHRDSSLFAVRFDTLKKEFSYYGERFSAAHQAVTKPVPVLIYKSAGKTGAVWMSDRVGLSRFDYRDSKFHPFLTKKEDGFDQVIRYIYEAPSQPGILWLNTVDQVSGKLRIARLDTRNKHLDYYDHANYHGSALASDSINSIYEDSRQRLWFTTQAGLLLFNRQTQAFTAFVPADTDSDAYKNRLTNIVEAKDGRLWLMNERAALCFDPDTRLFQRYDITTIDPDAVAGERFNGLMFDRFGVLWVYEGAGGVHKLDAAASAFSTYPLAVHDGSADQVGFTNNIATTTDGFCWYTNNQGLFKWKPGNDKPTQVYKTAMREVGLDALFIGNDGKAYFDNRHGLSIYDPKNRNVQNYAFNENDTTSISGNLINSIVQDHTGLVWIGTTSGGVCAFNPLTKKFTRYPFLGAGSSTGSKGKLDGYVVDCIYEDHQGTIWVGTHTGGLNRFDRKTGKFTSYYVDGKLNVYTVTHLFEDRSGHFWVGAYSLGLFEFDRKTGHFVKHINEDKGLLFNTVTGIEQDDKGYLWVGSVRGLSRIDSKSGEIKTFPLDRILPGKWPISDHNLAQANGHLVFALSDGVAVFNPRDLDPNPYPPEVHIEKVSYSNPASVADSSTSKIVYGTQKLELPHNQNRVTFRYVGLHFDNPEQNKYVYWLDGFDHHLVQAGGQRSVTYTNLPPGTYTFHVTAANSDGVWNKKGDSFAVIILSPWWATWWAWVLYIVVFVGAIYSFVAYRSRKLTKDKRVLEHKVHVRTEEVLQQKKEIEAQRDELEKAFTDLKTTQNQLIQSEKMASLGELTAGIAHEIQNPLNFVNNFSDVNREMLEELKAESEKPKAKRNDKLAIELINDLIANEQKINHHGKRADVIVKGMLEHSRSSKGGKTLTDINALADEFLKISYHGFRAKNDNFQVELVSHFDKILPKVEVIQQDIARVLLNLFNNAFYAVNEKLKSGIPGYKPIVEVITSTPPSADGGPGVVVSIRDNGAGIPDAIKDKIMQPFFTTKPTGEGTGLGLSLSYDIVVKGHRGKLTVESKEGQFTEFTITLPL